MDIGPLDELFPRASAQSERVAQYSHTFHTGRSAPRAYFPCEFVEQRETEQNNRTCHKKNALVLNCGQLCFSWGKFLRALKQKLIRVEFVQYKR